MLPDSCRRLLLKANDRVVARASTYSIGIRRVTAFYCQGCESEPALIPLSVELTNRERLRSGVAVSPHDILMTTHDSPIHPYTNNLFAMDNTLYIMTRSIPDIGLSGACVR